MAFKTVDLSTKFWVKEKVFSFDVLLGSYCRTCNGTGCTHEQASPAECAKWNFGFRGHGCIACPDCDKKRRDTYTNGQCSNCGDTTLDDIINTEDAKCQKCDKEWTHIPPLAKTYTDNLVGQNNTKQPSMVIFRLAPQDYHRFHYAVSGTIVDHYAIHGLLYSVNPTAVNQEAFKVFQENQRYVTVIETANGNRVIAIPVGAAMVGSIVFEEDDGASTVRVGSKIKAGQLHGKMRFGGSTVVYLFEEDMVKFDKDLEARSIKDWSEKIPCPSPTCTFNTIWEENCNDAAALDQALAANQAPCDRCSNRGFVEGATWPMMETYYQASERMGTTTIESGVEQSV